MLNWKETVGLQNRTIGLLVDLAECAGYGKAECLGLTFDATAVKIDFDVEIGQSLSHIQRLSHDITESLLLEVLLKGTAVDGDVAFACSQSHKRERQQIYVFQGR